MGRHKLFPLPGAFSLLSEEAFPACSRSPSWTSAQACPHLNPHCACYSAVSPRLTFSRCSLGISWMSG